ncbi:hypothetical protein OBP_035 [Pseudomonas phage OBP]|uniref:hypothetical protein n=1 Tax=Pseudomonas phage OBP TaxID=1124849 RepID=UPI000240D620|nr:hypothetical protein OBP_035 [Pseudomonas phage OBP]AEV89472.1 hypothetical protein OBP_035 [Pseudomonas phage OBP]
MMKLCGKTIPEFAEQIKKFLVEAVDKPNGEHAWTIGDDSTLPIYIDVQRNEASRMAHIYIKIGLVHLASGSAHFSTDKGKHKNLPSQLKVIGEMIDDNIWKTVNIILFADSGLSNGLRELFESGDVDHVESSLYGIRLKYNKEEDSQRLLISNLDDQPIYAIEEAIVPNLGIGLTSQNDLKDKIFYTCLGMIQQPTFEFDGELYSAHSKETSRADS